MNEMSKNCARVSLSLCVCESERARKGSKNRVDNSIKIFLHTISRAAKSRSSSRKLKKKK